MPGITLDAGEGRKLGLLVAGMVAFAHWHRHELRKRWLGEEQKPREGNPFDHPGVTYVLENAAIFGPVVASEALFPKSDRTRLGREAALLFARSVLMVESGLAFQKFMAEHAYANVPWFSTRTKPPGDALAFFRDWLRCDFIGTLASLAIQLALLRSLPKDKYAEFRDPSPLRVLPFLAKLALARVIVDVAFYAVHRAMHESKIIYDYVHRRHHEHPYARAAGRGAGGGCARWTDAPCLLQPRTVTNSVRGAA